ICCRLDFEPVEPLDGGGVDGRLCEPAPRIVELESDRVPRRQPAGACRSALSTRPVLQNECQMERIARPPHSSLAIEETLHPLGHRLPTDIEVADRQRVARIELQIAALPIA